MKRFVRPGLVLVAIGVLAFLMPSLLRAAQRNDFALNVKPLVLGMQWSDSLQVCASLVPPPVLAAPACANATGCYLGNLVTLRRGEWTKLQTVLGDSSDVLTVLMQGWGAWCGGDQARALEIWRSEQAIGQKFLRDGEWSLESDQPARALREGVIAFQIAPSGRSQFLVGRAHAALGDKTLALTEYRTALNMPDPTAAMYGETGELEWEFKDYTSARTHLAQATTLDKLSWLYWHRYGNVLYELQDWAGSEDAFMHAVRINPTNGDSYAGLAFAELQQGKIDPAQDAVRHMLSDVTSDRQKAGYLGTFAQIAASKGNLAVAADFYAQAVQWHPENSGFWGALFRTYVEMGDCPDLQTAYSKYQQVQAAQQKTPSPPPACPGKP